MKKNPQSLTSVSRYLSMLLRHKPHVAGLRLDKNGWADVAQLLDSVGRSHGLTMEMLEEIVRTDSKQRFSFNEDKTLIRANQGHSVPVDVELEELEPPPYLWHGTAKKYEESIDATGLQAGNRLYVHLSGDITTAINVGTRHGAPVVYRVDTGQMHADGYRFFRSVNRVWLTKYVPACYMTKQVLETE